MKIIKAFFILILLAVLVIIGIVCYSLFIEPHRLTTENVSISDSEISKDMTIAVFADTHFASKSYTMKDFKRP